MTDSAPTLSAPAEQATLVQHNPRQHRSTDPKVTAVLVTRGRTRYLRETLAAIAAQTRAPGRVLVVDVDVSGEASDAPAGIELDPESPVALAAAAALGELTTQWRALAMPGARTFGDAVRGALAAVPPVSPTPGDAVDEAGGRWLWLLHDDSAPEATALVELLRAVEHSSSVAVAGVKQRDWTDPARLLEVGVTTSRLGRRMTGVEEGEVDQGQHDGRVDVFAVGLAGALVRRAVWDELGGTDALLGPFGDGLDLCRRARLAGHLVVVVPSAAVRHAQASYLGIRHDDAEPGTGTGDGNGNGHRQDLPPDPRRSFSARRRAQVHGRLAGAPVVLLPFLGLGYLLAGIVRCLVRISTKEPALAVAELAAPVAALLHPGRMARARAVAREASRLPRRSLRPLQAGLRDVMREQRDAHFLRSERRRVGVAPSELELAEMAGLTIRRRLAFTVLAVALGTLTALQFGDLIAGVLGGGALAGGALLPTQADLGELWRAASSGWIAADLGASGPADPLLTALVPFAVLTGGGAAGATALLFTGSLLLAGLGAWFAAGAATRSFGVRLWAALAWVAAPGLALAVDGGRLGAVVAHVALPWVALGVARAVGVQRYDVVLSGLVGARRRAEPRPEDDDPTAVHPQPRAHPAVEVDRAAENVTSAGALSRAPANDTAAWLGDGEREVWPDAEADARAIEAAPLGADSPDVVAAGFSGARPTGSIGAAAAAGLAFAAATAGAPVLLPIGVLVMCGIGAVVPRRRWRLILVVLPALALFGPSLMAALVGADGDGWRFLGADPGLPVASTAALSWQQLLAWPVQPSAAVFGSLPGEVATVAPYVLGGVVALLALLALLRGSTVARGVRVGWLIAAGGLVAAFASAHVVTAAGPTTFVRGWPGGGVSLVLLGLLIAAVLGAEGLAARMARYAFGYRQLGVVGLALLAVLAPLAPLAEWVVRGRTVEVVAAAGAQVGVQDRSVVSAVGQQSQGPPDRSRVLALAVDEDAAIEYQLFGSDGPQLTDLSTAVDARAVAGALGSPAAEPPDAAAREVAGVVARIGTSAADIASGLSELAIGTVLVPPETSGATAAARSELVGRLDSTAGLERITENSSGVLWRVVSVAPAAQAVTSWARISTPARQGDRAASIPVRADRLAVDTVVPAGAADRLVVLAERADAGWHARLDGRPLRAVRNDWRQEFELGSGGGRLTVAYAPRDRMAWQVVQGAVGLLTVLLALPVRRRRPGATR